MACYLAYTSPARGHLYPIVDTLLSLSGRGHDVHVRTLASQVPGLQAAGLGADRIDPAIEAVTQDTWRAATPQEGLAQALKTFAARATHEVADLRRAIEQTDPDVVVVDITTPGAAAVAEASGIPWARSIPLLQQSWLWPGAPTGLTMVPFALEPAGLDVLNGVRPELGLPPFATGDEVWTAPLELYYTAPPLAPTGMSYPQSFQLVGPGLWEPPGETPNWLGNLDAPVVLVSVSSEFQRDDALIEAALAALAGEDIDVIVTTAAHDPAVFETPDNASLTSWAPHGSLVQRAACVVCHGGMGITQKSLAAGVPVCVVPFGRDQFDVVHRVAALGAGTSVIPQELTPGKTDLDREAMRSCWQGERKSDHDASRKRLGIDRMAIWIQQTPAGDLAIVYLEADDLEAAGKGLATSDEPFDRWFREHVREVHGVDVEEGLPPVEQVLDFRS